MRMHQYERKEERMRTARLALTVLVVLCCVTSVALSDDLAPPTWRGQAGSTLQQWEFSTDSATPAPEVVTNPYGTPSAAINIPEGDPFATGWWDGADFAEVYGSKRGWWDIGKQSLVLSIPNRPVTDPQSFKDIRIQITFWKDISQAPSVLISPTAVLVGTPTTTLVEAGPMGGGWYSVVSNWHLTPNPLDETITVFGDQAWGSMIDEIVVDTVCPVVPEPGTLMTLATGILGLAGLALRRRA
jgi:hypothetical protein